MTRYLDSALAIRHCSLLPSLSVMPRERAIAAPLTASGYPSVPMAGLGTSVTPEYGTHSRKRFAVAGVNANVWPLSPKDWSSG